MLKKIFSKAGSVVIAALAFIAAFASGRKHGKAEELMKNALERADSIRKAKNVEEKVSGMDDAAIRDAARKWVRDD